MIGQLPTSLCISNKQYQIRTDYRTVLLILTAYNDDDLSPQAKSMVCLKCLFYEWDKIPQKDMEEAYNQAVFFIDGGQTQNSKIKEKKLIDWEQDEQLIFSAINKVANKEVRAESYVHWWTFLAWFNEIGESTLLNVVDIRNKKNKGKRLEKHEQEFYRNNKHIIDFKAHYTQEEQAEIDYINNLFK